MDSHTAGAHADLAPNCLSCGAEAPRLYCAECGQRRPSGRHTLTNLVAGALGRVFNLETGLAHTVYNLSFRPEHVIGGYVSGATARYTHPAVYLLITFAVFSVSGKLFGGFKGGGDVERIAAVAFVPLVAGAARILFARAHFNYAEHLILAMYALGHVALLCAPVLTVFPLLETSTARVITVVALGGGIVYIASVYARVFYRHAVWAAVGGLAALLIGALAWGFILYGFILVIRR